MKELIFNIRDIFNDATASGCLAQYEATCFHIPAYQRGYKWSTGVGGAVTVLLDDIWSAFQHDEPEYYLQYITVKRQPLKVGNMDTYCLEVIDGQQRLTTLSILLSVITVLEADEDGPKNNIAARKLHYAIRRNFFDEYVYDNEKLKTISVKDWDSVIEEAPDLDRQDVFYLHGAILECFNFLEDKGQYLQQFAQYLCNAVKLIVNSVEAHIQSETVFKNLNSNKVPLTETELVKGLMITRVGRSRVVNADNRFRELLEIRLGLGSTWERIQQWCNRPNIRSFYFEGNADSLRSLLRLLAMVLDEKNLGKHKNGVYPLFDFYNQYADIDKALQKLNDIQQRLADWYEADDVYHLIGFCRYAKNNTHRGLPFIKNCLQKPTKKALISWLNKEKDQLIYKGKSNEAISELHYGQDNDQIHAVLLALSVFPNTNSKVRFDFDAFHRQDWSLEHIFPQTPEGKGHILKESHKQNIRDMLDDISEEVHQVLNLESRTPDERAVYENELRKIGVLDSIGNMCLLSKKDNSALGNQFFEGKRKKVLSLIRQGSFVPTHTFSVFSRMIEGLDGNIEQWSQGDIRVHTDYVVNNLIVENEAT